MFPLHPLEKQALHCIREHHSSHPGDHLLVAVSGGADSVALLHVLITLKPSLELSGLSVLHLDHQLRGTESQEDARFVRELADRHGLPLISRKIDVAGYQREQRVSLEMAARVCRHRFYRQTLAERGAQRVALGHTADDQAEEVLLRLIRGTGPAGLTGMKASTPDGIIRPLLSVTRNQILDYLRDRDLPFRTDRSNLAPFCQRNVLRLNILPLLREHFHPRVTETLSRCAQLAQDEELFWHGLVQHHWREACRSEDDGIIALSVAGLAALHPALQRRLLRFGLERLRGHLQAVNAVHIEALMRLLEPDKDRRELHLPGGLRAARTGDALILRRTAAPPAEPFERVLADAGWYEFPELRLELSFHELKEPGLADLAGLRADPNRAWMDANSLSWPLVVRSWRAGDWFQPLGLQGRKKLQDFFTDVKVPRDERAHIPLLCDQQKICWVVGYRLDDRVKVRAVTRQVLKVEWNRR